MDMAHASRALAQPWLVLPTLVDPAFQVSDQIVNLHGRTSVSTRRMDQDKALGAECTIMQLLGGTAYRNPSLTYSYMHTWQPLPNIVRTGGAVSAASSCGGGTCRSLGIVVQATKPPDSGGGGY